MSDLNLDAILAQLSTESKENISNVVNSLQTLDVPRFLNDPSIQHLPIESLPKRESYAEQLSEIGQISKVFNKLRERDKDLTDPFCDTPVKEAESRTERSFTQTIASYSRYISTLYATA